ncbi:hypothetical protein [Micromonospora sp. NPDC005206]|uniref:hypothetical protein n=1 Tax=Micromonospora sp. NPDC005206 TaxID=3157022 RepID=UPI0033A34E13
MGLEEVLSRVPFKVELASYCVQFHERNECSACTPEECPRLADAGLTLDRYRSERLERYRLLRTRSL